MFLASLDFTPEETWRLLGWCIVRGADEFTADFQPGQRGRGDALSAILVPREGREFLHLDEHSIGLLRRVFPEGLFQPPSYGSTRPWAEDPCVYRRGHPMLTITSHEGFGELDVDGYEQGVLATLGVRGGYGDNDAPSAALAVGPVTFRILPYEFPCVSGGPEDDWLRVHFRIESIPRVFVGYPQLNATLRTLAVWRQRMEAMLSGTVQDASLASARQGFCLNMTHRDDGTINVVVDGRQMEDMAGHLWRFSVEPSEIVRLCGDTAALTDHQARLPIRPAAALPNDPERGIRVGQRFLLIA